MGHHSRTALIAATAIGLALAGCKKTPQGEAAQSGAGGGAEAAGLIAEGLPEHFLYQLTAQASSANGAYQLSAGHRVWQPGETLKACFFGGGAVVRALVIQTASQWKQYANLNLDFGGPAGRDCTDAHQGISQIRIGFGEKGYWSLVGTDARDIATVLEPTMNLEGFDSRFRPGVAAPNQQLYTAANVVQLAPAHFKGVILHEFGHAIGLLHEQQNPKLNCMAEIRFAGPNGAYAYYGGPPNNWSPAVVDRNLGLVYASDPDAVPGDPDTKSIMMYALPPQIFRDAAGAHCRVAENNVISDGDKALTARLYPKNAPAVAEGTIVAVATPAAAASPAEARNLQADQLTRIRADLESADASVRRAARSQLAAVMQAPGAQALTRSLVDEAAKSSYRFQLGVAVALAKANPPALPKSAEAPLAKQVDELMKNAKDPTLRAYLGQAKAKLQD